MLLLVMVTGLELSEEVVVLGKVVIRRERSHFANSVLLVAGGSINAVPVQRPPATLAVRAPPANHQLCEHCDYFNRWPIT